MEKEGSNHHSQRSALLCYANPENDADLFYFGRVFVPDPFIAFGIDGKKYALVNRLEFNRVQHESAFDEVLPLETWLKKTKDAFNLPRAETADVICLIKKEWQINRFCIGPQFPAGVALELLAKGVKLVVEDKGLFPDRRLKTKEECIAIRESNTSAAAGIRTAQTLLESSTIQDGLLYFEDKPLTSEYIQREIAITCLQNGTSVNHTIVAGGDDACDPHCTGSGPLRANELIIVDVFPRSSLSGYYGDMTRTFLKGKASHEQRRLVQAVQEAQKLAIEQLHNNAEASQVHEAAAAHFRKEGFLDHQDGDIHQGFLHGTGHGLGLEIHESPSVSPRGGRLNTGMVVTIEPGLYYHGRGACRIEDVFCITDTGAEPLSNYPYDWEID